MQPVPRPTTTGAPAPAAAAGAATPARQWDSAALRSGLRAIVRDHASILALLFAYVAVALGIDASFPERDILDLRIYDEIFFVMLEAYTIVFLVGFSLRRVARIPAKRSVAVWIWEGLRDRYLTLERAGAFVLMLVYARILTDTFVSLKAAIPLLKPFSWDATFMRWDRELHGGTDPWRLLQPWVTPEITGALSFLYNLWIFVLFGIFIWQAWRATSVLRTRFFLTFGLAWMLLGGVAATALSSAGPCYFTRVTMGVSDPYAPLMSYLREVHGQYPVWALDVQEALWDAYEKTAHGAAPARATGHAETAAPRPPSEARAQPDASGAEKMMNGISAMPSMHVAMAVLFALLGWNVSRWLGAALTLYALAIQVGSVHLGWHYAIDGYASAVAVLLLWMLVGRILDLLPARPPKLPLLPHVLSARELADRIMSKA